MAYQLFLSKEPYISNDFFAVHCSPSLQNFSQDAMANILKKRNDILKYFGLTTFRKVQINLYDKYEDFITFTRQYYEPISYEFVNFVDGMLNFCVESSDLTDEVLYKIYMKPIIREFVHLIYKEEIQEKGSDKRVLWLDEGLAQYLSGENARLEDESAFKAWFLLNIVRRDKIIPDISFLKEQGDETGQFCDQVTNKYDGYDLSYTIIRFLTEVIPLEKLQVIIRKKALIDELGETVLSDMINYYNNKFAVKSNFEDLQTSEELFDYMNKNILYGWRDFDGLIHYDTMTSYRTVYRTSSVEDTIKNGFGSCIEQTQMEKAFFDKLGIQSKMFALRNYALEPQTTNEVRMHCFLLFESAGKWYHFEHANSSMPGIHQYDSLDAALKKIVSYYKERDNGQSRRLDEFDNIPAGLSFRQVNEYLDTMIKSADYCK